MVHFQYWKQAKVPYETSVISEWFPKDNIYQNGPFKWKASFITSLNAGSMYKWKGIKYLILSPK